MSWQSEIRDGKRFKFGENWKKFKNNNLTEEDSIKQAILSTKKSLDISGINIEDKKILDIGCGSGLFSLVALNLGAKHVTSFDFDPESVFCTRQLLESNNFTSKNFEVFEGSILDNKFINKIGKYDLVYSWGRCFIIQVI